MEKSKSMVLLEAVQKARLRSGIQTELNEKEKELNIMRSFFEKEYALSLLQENHQVRSLSLLDSLSKYRTLHAEITNTISKNHPEFQSILHNRDAIHFRGCFHFHFQRYGQ